MTATCFWRINPACELHWRRLDESWILFNAASAQTHLLSDLAVMALHLLQHQSLTEAALSQQLAACWQDEYPDTATQEYTAAMLSEMSSLGLIEPVV